MSIKSKVLAAAATLTLVGGIGTAGALTAGTASAATPSCGFTCINLFSYDFGTHKSPNFVVDVLRQGEKVGQPVILFRTANFDPAEDWTAALPGHRGRLLRGPHGVGPVALHYGCIPAAQPGSNFPNCPANVFGIPIPRRTAQTSWRSRTSTRRSAWTRACAWAWPRPRSTTRA